MLGLKRERVVSARPICPKWIMEMFPGMTKDILTPHPRGVCVSVCDCMDCSLPGFWVHRFSRQEGGSGLPFPPPGNLPDPGIETTSSASPCKSKTQQHKHLSRHRLAGSGVVLLGVEHKWNPMLAGQVPSGMTELSSMPHV